MRQDEYSRYRHFCTRKLRRCRTNTGEVRRRKVKWGKKAKYTAPTGLPLDKQMLVALFAVERSWAYAMELRKEAMTESRKVYQCRKKWKRACIDAQNLVKLLKENSFDEESILEAKAYALWMEGNKHFERNEWSEAYISFSLALGNYCQLKKEGLVETRCNEAESLIRYCEHNLEKVGIPLPQIPTADAINSSDVIKKDIIIRGITWTTSVNQDEVEPLLVKKITSLSKYKMVKGKTGDKRIDEYLRCVWATQFLNDLFKVVILKKDDGRLGKRNMTLFIRKALPLTKYLVRIGRMEVDASLKEESNFLANLLEQIIKGCVKQDLSEIDASGYDLKYYGDVNIKYFQGPSEEEYEMTPYGPQLRRIPVSAIENMDEFRVYTHCPDKIIFNPQAAKQMIPPKPIFYDLAFDLLQPPTTAF